MRRILFVSLLLALGGLSTGCKIVTRIGCETWGLWTDTRRMVFGVDYPEGQPESKRQRFYGVPAPGKDQPVCID